MIDFLSNNPLLVLIIPIIYFILFGFKIVREGGRLAVFLLGRFYALKGPGMVLNRWGNSAKWIPLNLGDSGELMDQHFGRFKEYNLPILSESPIPTGSKIRIAGFTEDKVRVVLAPDQRKSVTCEKCGHEINL